MPKSSFRFLLIACVAVVAAPAFGCGGHTIFSTTREDGTKVGIKVSDAEYASSPAWVPGTGEPPLAVAKAVDIAVKWAKAEYKRFDDVKVQSIDLNRLGCGMDKSKWYYLIDFATVIDGNTLYGGGYFVVVLMDGKIVPPRTLTEGK